MSYVSEIIEFLKAIFLGEKIDIINRGVAYFILTIVLVISLLILLIKYRMSYRRIALITISLTIYLSYFVPSYFPLYLEKANASYQSDLVFGQMWQPFYSLNIIDEFSLIVQIYIKPFALMLAFGVVCTITYKHLSNIKWFAVFSFCTIIFEIVFVVINNWLHGGLETTYDLTLPIIQIPALFIGFGLGKLLIWLNKDLYMSIFKPAEKQLKESII